MNEWKTVEFGPEREWTRAYTAALVGHPGPNEKVKIEHWYDPATKMHKVRGRLEKCEAWERVGETVVVAGQRDESVAEMTTRIDGPGLDVAYTIEPATTLLAEMATLPIA